MVVYLQYKLFMNKVERVKKKVNNYLFDHINLKKGMDITRVTFFSVLAALLYAFGFYCFITPSVTAGPLGSSIQASSVITGGVGGISQVVTLVLEVCGVKNVDPYNMQSILYFALNIPILAFAFFKIGKRFSLVSLINVGLSSVFIQVFKSNELFQRIADLVVNSNITRVIFAGLFVGLASATAYKNDVSCGGIDVLSYYFAQRKSTSVGKYTASLNSLIIVIYTILTIVNNHGNLVEVALMNLLFAILYLFVSTLVVDFINTRNKKVQVQVISDNPNISTILIANFPHSNTTVKGIGGYSQKEKFVVYMTVSSNESKNLVKIIKRIDPNSFVIVQPIIQAYGNFFIRPVE